MTQIHNWYGDKKKMRVWKINNRKTRSKFWYQPEAELSHTAQVNFEHTLSHTADGVLGSKLCKQRKREICVPSKSNHWSISWGGGHTCDSSVVRVIGTSTAITEIVNSGFEANLWINLGLFSSMLILAAVLQGATTTEQWMSYSLQTHSWHKGKWAPTRLSVQKN